MTIVEYLSDFLSIDSEQIKKYISTCPHRYKTYKIPKRNGRGDRVIAQPAKELKYLQKLVLNKYLLDLPVHKSCKAYIKEINIRDNALSHVKNKYLLKMDFKNFFPSINPRDLLLHIESHLEWNISDDDKFSIEKLFFYAQERKSKLRLSIGSPASPFISNTIMYEFDSKISDICEENGINYTRYADDISFSTNKKNTLFGFDKIIENVLNECQYPRIKINDKKSVFLSRKENMHITGLVLSNNGEVSLGRSKKRYVKSLVFKYINKLISDEDKTYLKGYLSFCWSVEPSFITRLENKYGRNVINEIREIKNG